jgi:hypothetical protein
MAHDERDFRTRVGFKYFVFCSLSKTTGKSTLISVWAEPLNNAKREANFSFSVLAISALF